MREIDRIARIKALETLEPEIPRLTDDMVERAARAMWRWEFEEGTGLASRDSWWPDQVENPGHYRTLAYRALDAALGEQE